METSMAVFRGKEIRKTTHNNEWWFVVEDVVLALIDSTDPKQYIQEKDLGSNLSLLLLKYVGIKSFIVTGL